MSTHAVGVAELSARNRQILELVAAGHTTKAISSELGLSVSGVEKHLRQLFLWYAVSNRAALVGEAFRRGDLTLPVQTVP